MDRPLIKVVKDGKKWGVKVKWPRRGPFARTMLFPRYVWHGPFGNKHARWDTNNEAISVMNTLELQILDILKDHG